MMMSITSCATNGVADPVVVDTACNWVQPVYLTEQDIMTLDEQTKRAILSHNEKWDANCKGAIAKGTNP